MKWIHSVGLSIFDMHWNMLIEEAQEIDICWHVAISLVTSIVYHIHRYLAIFFFLLSRKKAVYQWENNTMIDVYILVVVDGIDIRRNGTKSRSRHNACWPNTMFWHPNNKFPSSTPEWCLLVQGDNVCTERNNYYWHEKTQFIKGTYSCRAPMPSVYYVCTDQIEYLETNLSSNESPWFPWIVIEFSLGIFLSFLFQSLSSRTTDSHRPHGIQCFSSLEKEKFPWHNQ